MLTARFPVLPAGDEEPEVAQHALQTSRLIAARDSLVAWLPHVLPALAADGGNEQRAATALALVSAMLHAAVDMHSGSQQRREAGTLPDGHHLTGDAGELSDLTSALCGLAACRAVSVQMRRQLLSALSSTITLAGARCIQL